jgi:OFA family oxalate/formate antiporter-like MFS transporter
MFSAYGAGGLVGPFLAASLMKVVEKIPFTVTELDGKVVERLFDVGNYRPAFIVSGAACLVAAAVISLAMKAPQK